jgi:outer membrane protein OmpA-like peptidoglycan-associated protein
MKKLFPIILLVFVFVSLNGQKSLKKQAEDLYKKGNYLEVVKALEQYKNINNESNTLLLLAESYFKTNQQAKSIEKYKLALENLPEKIEIYYSIAKCYDELAQYDNALVFYKRYLAEELDKKNYHYDEAINQIKRIGFARKIKFQPQIAFVENVGNGINTIYDENKPVQSRYIQSRFYFTSNRETSKGGLRNLDNKKGSYGPSANSDIFVFETNNGTIIDDEVTSQYNTEESELVEEINGEGNAIIYQKNGSVIIDTFNVEGERITSSLLTPYNPNNGDKDLRMFNDSTIIFASYNYPGYGGYDLFITTLDVNSTWKKPLNLGPAINTTFNEVSPFFTKGGNTLFFSSDRTNSIGGYDIFGIQFEGKGWSKEVNLGPPINSTKDDISALVSNDGNQIYFCSNRVESLGGNDIYVAYLKEQIKDQLMYNEVLPLLATNENLEPILTSEDILKIEPPKQKLRTFINPILYYRDDADVLSIANQNLLKNIKTIYDIFPELNISIISHSGIDNDKSSALFFGLKRTESIREELVNMGVKASSINQCSYGTTFPGTYEKTRYNSRIEFILSGVDKSRLSVVNDEINLNSDVKHLSYDQYSQNKSDLVFKVKVAESFQMLKSVETISLPKMSVHRDGSKYEYYTGYTTVYNDIRIIHQDLQTKGYNNIDIIPFIGHKKISKETAEILIDKYPELKQYLGR